MANFERIAPHIFVEQNIYDNDELLSYRGVDKDEYWTKKFNGKAQVYMMYLMDIMDDEVTISFEMKIGNSAGTETTDGNVSLYKTAPVKAGIINVNQLFNKYKTAKTIRKHLYEIINDKYTQEIQNINKLFSAIYRDSNELKGYLPPLYQKLLIIGQEGNNNKCLSYVHQFYADQIEHALKEKLAQLIANHQITNKYFDNSNWYSFKAMHEEAKAVDKELRHLNPNDYYERYSLLLAEGIEQEYLKLAQKHGFNCVPKFDEKIIEVFTEEFKNSDDTLVEVLSEYYLDPQSSESFKNLKEALAQRKLIIVENKRDNIYAFFDGKMPIDSAKLYDDQLNDNYLNIADNLVKTLKKRNEQLLLHVDARNGFGTEDVSNDYLKDLITLLDDPKHLFEEMATAVNKKYGDLHFDIHFFANNQLVFESDGLLELRIITNSSKLKDELNRTYLKHYQQASSTEMKCLINQCLLKHSRKLTLSNLANNYYETTIQELKDAWDNSYQLNEERINYIDNME